MPRSIAQICLRLDGLPLAIELAAARIKLLPPQALLARLDRRLQVLTGGARDLPLRQQTLRNTLAWSYELLTAEEQRLFRRALRLCWWLHAGAAEAVCAANDGGAYPCWTESPRSWIRACCNRQSKRERSHA